MNVYHQVKMSLRHYLSFTQLWRLILPLAYIGQTASQIAFRDDPGDGKGAVVLTQEIHDPSIHFAFDAYFEVSLQMWRRDNSDNNDTETPLTYELGKTRIHVEILPTSIEVEPGDLLWIKIRKASPPSRSESPLPLPNGSSTATTTPTPQLSTTRYSDVNHSSTRVETTDPPIATTTPTSPSSPTLIIAAVIPVILVLTLIVILFVIIARMRRRKPGDGELEQDYNDIYLDGGPYTSIRSENTDSMAKGPRALRKDRPRLKLDPDTPLQVNPDRVPNVRKVTYLQWISDMMPEVGLTGRHPNPVKNAGRVPGSSTGDGDDDGERYLKPISERSGFDNPGCDVFAYQTDDVFFAQLDPGQFMLLSGAIDSSDRPTRLPWGIPGDSPMTSQSSEDDQTYIDMNRYHYSPIPRRERSNGSDGGLAGNGVADRGPHTYLELLPDDDDVTGQRSKQAKYVAVPQTRTVPPVHRTVVSM